MSVITTLLSSDALEPTSRQNINTNFANLNTDKQEKPVGAVTNNIVLFGASNVLVDSGKAVPTGTIVGTSDAQALTNKDLSSATNTFPATLVTTTGVQTLTNKTLTSPVISDFTNAGHNHQNAAGGGQLTEGALLFSDVTTGNASSGQHGLLPKLSGIATDVLHGDGSYGPSGSTGIMVSTAFETSARFLLNGSVTFGTTGAVVNTPSTASTGVSPTVFLQLVQSSQNALNGSPQFGVSLSLSQGSTGNGTFYFGIGNPVSGGLLTFTLNHVGFKIVGNGSNQQLFATVGNGTSNTTSAALLTNLAANDQLELLVVMNGNTSATFYYRKNGGAQSSVTINTNIPASGATSMQNLNFETSNNNVANVYGATLYGAHWSR